MPVPGANNIDGGVSIDLHWLNQTRLSPDRSFVSLGAGASWASAYDSLAAHGVAVPGGVCGTTGVGGVTLGGGQSLFQPRMGWVVDNVLRYEIVLASGYIATVSATHQPDLYRALKGGGTNFGIVTRVDIAVHDQQDLWAGQIIVPAENATIDQALEATTAFTERNNLHVDAALQTVFVNFANGTKVIDFAVASTDGTVNPEILQPFTSMTRQILNTVKTRSLSDTVEEYDMVLRGGYRQLFATITFINDATTMRAVQAVFDRVYLSLRWMPGLDWIIFYNPQPRVIETFSAGRGGNVLGLESGTDDLIAFISPRWLDSRYDDAVFQAAQTWVTGATEATRALGTSNPFVYMNFALSSQKPFCSYGADNEAFLRRTAEKYDPERVFQTLVPGGFKVSVACHKETCRAAPILDTSG